MPSLLQTAEEESRTCDGPRCRLAFPWPSPCHAADFAPGCRPASGEARMGAPAVTKVKGLPATFPVPGRGGGLTRERTAAKPGLYTHRRVARLHGRRQPPLSSLSSLSLCGARAGQRLRFPLRTSYHCPPRASPERSSQRQDDDCRGVGSRSKSKRSEGLGGGRAFRHQREREAERARARRGEKGRAGLRRRAAGPPPCGYGP